MGTNTKLTNIPWPTGHKVTSKVTHYTKEKYLCNEITNGPRSGHFASTSTSSQQHERWRHATSRHDSPNEQCLQFQRRIQLSLIDDFDEVPPWRHFTTAHSIELRTTMYSARIHPSMFMSSLPHPWWRLETTKVIIYSSQRLSLVSNTSTTVRFTSNQWWLPGA